MTPVIYSASASNFEATLTAAAGADLLLTLKGSAENDAREQLPSLLDKLDQTAMAKHSKQVEVDFRQVDFMNSSCFKEFVAWLSRIKTRNDAAQYQVLLHSSIQIRWQRASMHALSCFASDVVAVKAE